MDAKQLICASKEKMSDSLRISLNIITGWKCIGFCQGEDEKSQSDCAQVCGPGRFLNSKKLTA
jgi:hypothetical protein